MNNELDFVAIGDIVTDAFIRMKDAEVNCDIDKENCKLCVRFGDKVPYESVEVVAAVGNSPNASVSAARLGLKSTIVTDMGDDFIAQDSIRYLKSENIDPKFIHLHKGKKSNYHYVLWYDIDRTILVKHEEYTRSFPDVGSPKWFYLSSLGADSASYHDQIIEYIEKHPNIKLAFQPGTFQMKLGTEKLKKIYERTNIFFCNREESQRILKTDEKDIGQLLKGIHKLGPKIVCITDGPNGAYAYDGEGMWFMPTFPPLEKAFERTGEGDAFASSVTSALCLGLPLEEALRWGPINAGSVGQQVGAQKGLLTRAKLEEWLSQAKPEYRPRRLV
jgi:sugar/nucleoside kinase (ribokinase family)